MFRPRVITAVTHLALLLFACALLAAPPDAAPTGTDASAAASPEQWPREFVLPMSCSRGLVFARDGKKLLTVDAWEAQVWDTRTWKPIGNTFVHGERLTPEQYQEKSRPKVGRPVRHPDTMVKAEFDAAAERMLTVAQREAILWEIATGKAVGKPFEHGGGPLYDAAVSPDGKLIATCDGKDHHVHLYDAASGALIRKFNHGVPVSYVQFDRPGTTLVTTGSNTCLWTVKTGERRTVIPGSWHDVVRPALSDNGVIIAVSGGGYRIVEIDTGKEILFDDRLLRKNCQMYGVAISPDGKKYAASSSLDSSIYNLEKLEAYVSGLQSFDGDVFFDPVSGAAVVLSLEDSWGIWDLPGEKRVRVFDEREVWIHKAAFSPDGRFLAHACRGGTRIIEPRSGVTGPQRWMAESQRP